MHRTSNRSRPIFSSFCRFKKRKFQNEQAQENQNNVNFIFNVRIQQKPNEKRQKTLFSFLLCSFSRCEKLSCAHSSCKIVTKFENISQNRTKKERNKKKMNSNILHWSYRDFREFPRELIEYGDRVEEIYLKENFIPTIPLWLFDFNHLKFIHLSGNALEIIPDEISTLVNLEYLNVSRNHIKRLPKSIASMKKLQYLNVSENEIDTLHKGESQLSIFFFPLH